MTFDMTKGLGPLCTCDNSAPHQHLAAAHIAPNCHYWPEHNASALNNAVWRRMEELLKAVQATAKLVGWSVEEEHGSGAWYWTSDPCCDVGHAGYATPEWEGAKGGLPLQRFDMNGDAESDTEWLQLELTGVPEMDALRIVLKVVNQFQRGY